jgi:dynein heavy chain
MMPVIQALGNKDLRQRHWKKIFEILGSSSQPGKTFTLSELISEGVLEKKDQMEEISGRASGEAAIEMQVEEIKKKW